MSSLASPQRDDTTHSGRGGTTDTGYTVHTSVDPGQLREHVTNVLRGTEPSKMFAELKILKSDPLWSQPPSDPGEYMCIPFREVIRTHEIRTPPGRFTGDAHSGPCVMMDGVCSVATQPCEWTIKPRFHPDADVMSEPSERMQEVWDSLDADLPDDTVLFHAPQTRLTADDTELWMGVRRITAQANSTQSHSGEEELPRRFPWFATTGSGSYTLSEGQDRLMGFVCLKMEGTVATGAGKVDNTLTGSVPVLFSVKIFPSPTAGCRAGAGVREMHGPAPQVCS